jgi:ComF family protein
MLLKELKQGLSHLFYPRLCEGCSKPLLHIEAVLCMDCQLQLPRTYYHDIADNETAIRFAGRVPFAHATSFAYFTNDGLLQHLLHGLKYGNKKEIGIYLGKQFGNDLKPVAWLSSVDAIIPVPLHGKKERSRGYNQSLLIAKGMSEILQIPVYDNVLLRTRHTESQTQKTRSERIRNMQDAFQIRSAKDLADKHVLLIDDVLTTGATLEACAKSILMIPAVKLSIATIGIATS